MGVVNVIWVVKLLKWISGGGLLGLAAEMRQAHQNKLAAENDGQRVAADHDIARIAAQIEAQTRGAGTWLPKVTRALWSAPFILYVWKLIVWDKMLGWGVTDGLGDYELWVGKVIIVFYFVTGGFDKMRQKNA